MIDQNLLDVLSGICRYRGKDGESIVAQNPVAHVVHLDSVCLINS